MSINIYKQLEKIVLNIPAPIIAATPKAVKSTTLSVRFMPRLLSASKLASFRILETDFFRNKLSNLTRRMYSGKNKENSIPETVSCLPIQPCNVHFTLMAIA